MNKSYRFFTVSFVALCACAPVVAAQNAPTFMSKYGEIQSVNKYSSNPFWSPDSPYNQRFPTPIYATGPDVNTGDCNRIVQNLITEYCASRGDCANARTSDIRPHIMVSLSQLPGHNFATSCGGYIDTAFENYQKTYGNSSTGTVNIVPTQNKMAAPSIQIKNPFKQTKSMAEIAMDARTAELENLQRQTTPTAAVTPAAFPKTIDDLSFTDRMANTSAGYEPYKDLKAYKTPKFETEDEYYERMKSVLTHNISYIGAGAKGCPQTYMTGRGATVSCTPTINHGTCSEWCTDAALTNCQTSYTISPNDRDDKTFYANCKCDAGYEMTGNKCVKPGTPVAPVDPVIYGGCEGPNPEHRDPTTCECYQSDFMGSDCECLGISTWNATNKKCECPQIDKGTLNDIEWDIAKQICNCPLKTQTYNTTTHLCESDQNQSDDGETYTLLQCRSETIPNYTMLGDGNGNMADPFTELGCKTNTPNSLRKCFTRCAANYNNDSSPGLVNKTLSAIIPEKFCTGYFTPSGSYAFPVGFFSYADNPRMLNTTSALQIMTFDSAQIVSIKNAINSLAQSDREKYCYTNNDKYWLIYILKQTNTNTWKVAEKPLILYHDN